MANERHLTAKSACLILGIVFLSCATAARAAAPLGSIDEINQALAAAKPGETVVIKNGVYRDATIVMNASGEQGKLITLEAETPGQVFFTGQAPHQSTATITLTGKYLHVTGLVFHKNTGGMSIWFKNAQHSRLSHCAFNESGESRSVFTHMIEVGEDSADNEVDHCYMGKSISMSIGTRGGSLRCHYHHNWWHDIVARASNGQEPLQLQHGRAGQTTDMINTPEASLFAVVEHNLFDGACGDEEIISLKSNDNVVRYNTFLAHPTNNKGGVNIRHGHRNVVDSNFFIGADYGVRVSGDENVVTNNYIERPTHGIRLTGGGTNGWAYIPARNGLYANNTIVEANYSAVEIGSFIGMKDPKGSPNLVNIYPSGNRVINNILISTRVDRVVGLPAPELAEVLPNEFKNNVGWCTKAKSPDDVQVPDGVLIADPMLAKDGDRFAPQTGSPALGKGLAIEQVTLDINGRPRTSSIDIGCEQISNGGSAQIRRPLTPEDVGPDWMGGDATMLDKEAAILELKDLIGRHPDPEFRQRLRQTIDGAK